MRIKDLFEINKAITTSREFFDDNKGIPCVHYGDIYRFYNEKTILSSNILNKFTLNLDKLKPINQDSIIMPDVTETITDFGHLTYIKYDKIQYINGTHTLAILNNRNNNLKYLFYYLQSSKIKKQLQTLLLGSTVFQISKKDLENFELQSIHNESEQRHIVDTVGSLDDKIENNNKIIIKLEELLNLKFKNIYSDALKTGITINLNDIVNLKTGKKDANAANENGIYPFFTCSEKESNIDVYSFNQEAILIAGNGNMSVKYFNGKFDAYQRTYVISSSKYFYYLYLYYKNFIGNISVGAKGSVIKFLTKSMLLDIDLPILDNITMQKFESDIQKILNYELRLSEENKKINLLKENYLKRFF